VHACAKADRGQDAQAHPPSHILDEVLRRVDAGVHVRGLPDGPLLLPKEAHRQHVLNTHRAGKRCFCLCAHPAKRRPTACTLCTRLLDFLAALPRKCGCRGHAQPRCMCTQTSGMRAASSTFSQACRCRTDLYL